jgi:hypothetical protein
MFLYDLQGLTFVIVGGDDKLACPAVGYVSFLA